MPDAPAHLGKEGEAFWTALATDSLSPAQEYLLCLAAEQVDLQERCRKRIARLGPTLTTKTGVVKARPELAIERGAARLIQSLIRQLDLGPEREHKNRGRVVRHSDRIARERR